MPVAGPSEDRDRPSHPQRGSLHEVGLPNGERAFVVIGIYDQARHGIAPIRPACCGFTDCSSAGVVPFATPVPKAPSGGAGLRQHGTWPATGTPADPVPFEARPKTGTTSGR
ncbi:hypothetical protein GCM10022376_01440 [Yimella lutea]